MGCWNVEILEICEIRLYRAGHTVCWAVAGRRDVVCGLDVGSCPAGLAECGGLVVFRNERHYDHCYLCGAAGPSGQGVGLADGALPIRHATHAWIGAGLDPLYVGAAATGGWLLGGWTFWTGWYLPQAEAVRRIIMWECR